ncbi:MAG: chorismate synthase [Oscillospiraceae bacterium]|nr:chorismate synthase [Oscillospiraceae bacterium]
MRYIIFGESHGPAIGVTIENPPSGIKLDEEFIASEMQRRAPGQNSTSTARKEADKVEILSGVYNGYTTGTPLCAVIRNTDTKSKDYEGLRATPRPSHADFTGQIRYGGFNDVRGGGHFSGRLTAPLVFAGSLAKLALKEKGINITSSISNIGGVKNPTPEQAEEIILKAKSQFDSVGGSVKCVVSGVLAGFGAPDLGLNAEGIISQYMFSIPAVKGIAFGAGFGFADMLGSEANDAFCYENGKVNTKTNHSGGINGGITNGMPIEFEVAFRPTPSIAKEQQTVDLVNKCDSTLVIEGRHDPCIVLRAAVVAESAAALAICELMGI